MSIIEFFEREDAVLRIKLDPATKARLLQLADMCDAEPEKIAASMLHDILQDDAMAEANIPPRPANLN